MDSTWVILDPLCGGPSVPQTNNKYIALSSKILYTTFKNTSILYSLTNWPLKDVIVILKWLSWNTCGLMVKLLSGECHTRPRKIGAIRQQAIAWANVDLELCCHMVSPGHNELKGELPMHEIRGHKTQTSLPDIVNFIVSSSNISSILC